MKTKQQIIEEKNQLFAAELKDNIDNKINGRVAEKNKLLLDIAKVKMFIDGYGYSLNKLDNRDKDSFNDASDSESVVTLFFNYMKRLEAIDNDIKTFESIKAFFDARINENIPTEEPTEEPIEEVDSTQNTTEENQENN